MIFRKSTFFNVLTKSAASAENFPFCTIGQCMNEFSVCTIKVCLYLSLSEFIKNSGNYSIYSVVLISTSQDNCKRLIRCEIVDTRDFDVYDTMRYTVYTCTYINFVKGSIISQWIVLRTSDQAWGKWGGRGSGHATKIYRGSRAVL